jgi:hypothetical protein
VNTIPTVMVGSLRRMYWLGGSFYGGGKDGSATRWANTLEG